MLRAAIEQAKDGRHLIMEKMKEAARKAPKSKPAATPTIKTITVPESSVRLLIGPGGSVIKDLCARTGANIDIAKQGGLIKVSAIEAESVDIALKLIESIVNPPKDETPPLETGKIYPGVVKKIFDGYLVIKFENGASGSVYGYNIAFGRFERIEDVFMVGEKVHAKVLAQEGEDIKLSLRAVDQETGRDVSNILQKESRESN
jgi:polyribonucleotide nucleotidyltransferase